jgi:hypothetical protein
MRFAHGRMRRLAARQYRGGRGGWRDWPDEEPSESDTAEATDDPAPEEEEPVRRPYPTRTAQRTTFQERPTQQPDPDPAPQLQTTTTSPAAVGGVLAPFQEPTVTVGNPTSPTGAGAVLGEGTNTGVGGAPPLKPFSDPGLPVDTATSPKFDSSSSSLFRNTSPTSSAATEDAKGTMASNNEGAIKGTKAAPSQSLRLCVAPG